MMANVPLTFMMSKNNNRIIMTIFLLMVVRCCDGFLHHVAHQSKILPSTSRTDIPLICYLAQNNNHSIENDPNPVFPSSPSLYQQQERSAAGEQQSQQQSPSQHQSNTRFSKFAPSTELSSDDFRKQLKERMKQDLEERRRADPNRGNQPAKNYLDSL
jgi:hypothetical protein